MLVKPWGYFRIRANSGASESVDLGLCEGSRFNEDCEDVVCVGVIAGDSEVSEVIAYVLN